MNDHSAAIKDFDSMFNFLHEKYFLRVAFNLIYLSKSKTHIFAKNLELLDFHNNAQGLRPSLKHRQKVE